MKKSNTKQYKELLESLMLHLQPVKALVEAEKALTNGKVAVRVKKEDRELFRKAERMLEDVGLIG